MVLWVSFVLSDMPFPDFLNGVPQKDFLLSFLSSLIQDFFPEIISRKADKSLFKSGGFFRERLLSVRIIPCSMAI